MGCQDVEVREPLGQLYIPTPHVNPEPDSTYLMLKSCVGYNNILSDYVNCKIGEIKITLDY